MVETLCKVCTDLIRRVFKRPTIQDKSSTEISLSDFLDSLHQRCHICSILAANFLERYGEVQDVTLLNVNDVLRKYLDAAPSSFPDQAVQLPIELDLGKSLAAAIRMECDAACDAGGNVDFDVSLHVFAWKVSDSFSTSPAEVARSSTVSSAANSRFSNTGDPAAWTRVQRWMNECLANHGTCALEHTPEDFYPRRLVDVGIDEEQVIKVVDTHFTNPPLSGHYTTLSHCWGTAMPLRLLTTNADVLYSGVSLEDLPKTFREAAVVTRRLGVRYIWIDSLCIVQDDLDDWRREASMMADVYRCSFCNIASLASTDSSGGLFRRRRDHHTRPASIQIGETHLLPGKYSVYRSSQHRDIKNSPLTSRSWIMQERFFSRRTLIWGEKQIYWECNFAVTSEECPINLSVQLLAPWSPFKYFQYQIDPITPIYYGHGAPKDLSVRFRWAQLVCEYQRCSLTFERDKLVAISAIAKYIQGLRSTTYIAGLWERSLPNDLCWKVEYPSSRRTSYRAPSWSWAAVNVPLSDGYSKKILSLYNWDRKRSAMISLASFEVTPVGADETGEVLDAWICIQCQALAIQMFELKRPQLESLQIRWDYTDFRDASEEKSLHLIPLVFHKKFQGIVVEHAPDRGIGFYRRVAYFALKGRALDEWKRFCYAVEWSREVLGDHLPDELVPEVPKQAMILV